MKYQQWTCGTYFLFVNYHSVTCQLYHCYWDHHGRDLMVVGFTTTCAIATNIVSLNPDTTL